MLRLKGYLSRPGLWIAALSVQYRDVKFALSFMLPIFVYVAPVPFPASFVL